MPTKKPEVARPVLRRKPKKPRASSKPKRNPWTRVDGEIHGHGYKLGYARVSTLDQNLALQQDALEEAGCGEIFIEQMSGAVTERPALAKALEYARSGDILIVWKLDRLARSTKQLIDTIEKLRLRGIGFRSLTESIDTTTPQGVLVFHMFSALAEFERALIRERTRAGLKAAKRMGRIGGRPAKLSDDDLDVARTLLANPDITVADVADRIGVSPATLYRYLPAARSANSPDISA
jgi:DNA invertase Pin-like site-specific DNA recombinase